jgi:hypothetical protein
VPRTRTKRKFPFHLPTRRIASTWSRLSSLPQEDKKTNPLPCPSLSAEAANKKAETARKKAEKDALLAEEEKDQPSKPKGAGAKTAQKKTRGLDLSALDSDSTTPSTALNATGIDNALDALSLTSNTTSQLDRHPERRYKAALAAYEAKRLPELDEEMKGLRRNQKIELIRKEFEKSEDNPFNKANVRFDATREEIDAVRRGEREKVEGRLAER